MFNITEQCKAMGYCIQGKLTRRNNPDKHTRLYQDNAGVEINVQSGKVICIVGPDWCI